MAVQFDIRTTKRFSLHCYEDENYNGDHHRVTETQTPVIPDDEITSIQLEGDAGLVVELFNGRDFDPVGGLGVARIANVGQRIDVPHLDSSVAGYLYDHGKVAGKVDSIRIR